MKDVTILIYGFDFSDSENYPIKETNAKLVIPKVIEAIYNSNKECYEDEDQYIVSSSCDGYGDENYYIGVSVIDTEEDKLKNVVKKYNELVSMNKNEYEKILMEKINTIISYLKDWDDVNSPIYGIPDDYCEYAISYFEKLKTIKNRYAEIESTD